MRRTVKFVEGLGSVHFNQIWKERKKRGKKKMRRRKGEGEEEQEVKRSLAVTSSNVFLPPCPRFRLPMRLPEVPRRSDALPLLS